MVDANNRDLPYRDPDEPPRTFGCHHFAESCPLCEGMVERWKAKRGLNDGTKPEVNPNDPLFGQ